MSLMYTLVLAVVVVAADEPSEAPGQLTWPPDAQDSYQFVLPIDCVEQTPHVAATCFYYLAVRRNPVNGSLADFHLSATTQGYVAVGFSKDSLMGEDDVIGCKRDPQTGNIIVVSAWNPAPQHAPNIRDPSQRGVSQDYFTSYSDGQLSCRFSRYIAPVNPGYDYDLNNSYYLFLARSDNGSSPHFLKHEETPLISYFPINVLHDNTTNAGYIPRGGLIKAHGVLMMMAWLLIYVVLFLFGSAKKEYVIDYSRKNWWFQTIRAVSIMTIIIMVIGILLVIIANRDNSSHGLISSSCGFVTSHAVMGYITPLTLVAYLVLFHVIIPPNHFRSESFICIALLCGLCFFFALFMVILSGIFGLVLFQAGCALLDNLSLVLIVCLTFFLKYIALCAKIVFFIISGCCMKRDVKFPCCYRNCPCTPNKLMCFKWIVYLLIMVPIVIVMLVAMVFIAISPTLGYIGQ